MPSCQRSTKKYLDYKGSRVLFKITDMSESLCVIKMASARPKFSGILTCVPTQENKKIAMKRLLRSIK